MHVHRPAVAAIGGPLVLLSIVAINQLVLLDFPNSGDEHAYLYQARTLAAGRLWNGPVDQPEIFATSYIVHEPHRTFGSFPVGWPLALGVAEALDIAAWLVNGLLGVVTLALVWVLGTRLYAPRIGVLAAALVAISPFFLFNAASYFSHTLCGALLLGAACLAARETRTPWWVPFSVGMLLGWAVLARYHTGLVCGVPIALWLLRRGVDRAPATAWLVAGGLPWIVGLLAYNTALSGSPWQLTTTPLTMSRWFADGFALRGADILASHLLRHLSWTPPALVVAYVVYLCVGRRDTRRGGFDWLLVAVAFTLYFYMERGGNQYGPRFHYEVFPFLVLFVSANVFRERVFADKGRRDRLIFAGLALSVAVTPLALLTHSAREHLVVRERMDPYTMVAAAGLRQSLVLIRGRVGSARSMAAADLTRNGIDHDASVLYGIDPGEAARCAVRLRLPGRATYLYAWNAELARGALSAVRCPSNPPVLARARPRKDSPVPGRNRPPLRLNDPVWTYSDRG